MILKKIVTFPVARSFPLVKNLPVENKNIKVERTKITRTDIFHQCDVYSAILEQSFLLFSVSASHVINVLMLFNLDNNVLVHLPISSKHPLSLTSTP